MLSAQILKENIISDSEEQIEYGSKKIVFKFIFFGIFMPLLTASIALKYAFPFYKETLDEYCLKKNLSFTDVICSFESSSVSLT